jgi:3-deoxy-manno-octulosonate cytidylyltransferase (CMP-KDO synthetase)
MLKQICIIPFRRDYLTVFNNTTPTPLEVIESVDMLRVLESGGLVQMVRTESESYGVDTPEDLELVTRKMENDPLMRSYLGVRR